MRPFLDPQSHRYGTASIRPPDECVKTAREPTGVAVSKPPIFPEHEHPDHRPHQPSDCGTETAQRQTWWTVSKDDRVSSRLFQRNDALGVVASEDRRRPAIDLGRPPG